MKNQFSVLMAVYHNDKPEFVVQAVDSITKLQTLKPDEVIIVIDGPIPDKLLDLINDFEKSTEFNFNIMRLPENKGLGNALRVGMENATHEYVARMDADDLSVYNRFEKQIQFMNDHPDIAVCGTQISEFVDRAENIVAYRFVPLSSEDCKQYYRDRDPLNHVSVMFRKSAVLEAGNYQSWHLDEDTYLWGRLLLKGFKIANIPDILVNVRVGEQMYARRGGWKYFKSDTKILTWKLKHGLTGKSRFIYNYAARFIVQVVMPNKIRGWFFKKILRN